MRKPPPSALVAQALRAPQQIPQRASSWEALIGRAREAGLLATLACRVDTSAGLDGVPAAPRAHLVAALHQCRAQHAAVRRETAEIARALAPLRSPVVLLKGTAYLMADLPPADGRLFSDIDILVPRSRLPDVEAALMLAGFATTHLHPYDQRYYRRWMHELPPMQHVKRLTILDVHHTIVPETSDVALDASALFRGATPLVDAPPFSVLSPSDMVIHSATHLFQNEEFTHGLRDLVDIDRLLTHFGTPNPSFWRTLVARAGELDLERPLYYALRFTSRLLGTRIPEKIASEVKRLAPPRPIGLAMDQLLGAALQPTAEDGGTRWARRALYLRGHWLKMPTPLLAYHLTWKALRRDEDPAHPGRRATNRARYVTAPGAAPANDSPGPRK